MSTNSVYKPLKKYSEYRELLKAIPKVTNQDIAKKDNDSNLNAEKQDHNFWECLETSYFLPTVYIKKCNIKNFTAVKKHSLQHLRKNGYDRVLCPVFCEGYIWYSNLLKHKIESQRGQHFFANDYRFDQY